MKLIWARRYMRRKKKKIWEEEKREKNHKPKKKEIWVEKGGVLNQLILEGKEEINKERKIKKKEGKFKEKTTPPSTCHYLYCHNNSSLI